MQYYRLLSRKSLSRCLSTLSYEQYGDKRATKTAVFVHGMLGSKKNMRTPCREFMKTNSGYSCVTVDVRGHGDSHGLQGDATIAECARDLEKLFESLNISPPEVIVAHSLAGKIALKYLQNRMEAGASLPHNAWILDSLPGPYHTIEKDPSDGTRSVASILEELDNLAMPQPTRTDVVKSLTQRGIELPIAQWLGTSLQQNSNGVEWVFDLKVARELFENFILLDMRHFLHSYQGDCVIHFVRAGRSAKWTPEALEFFDEIIEQQEWQDDGKYKNLQLHTMPNAGHWLHSEDLPGLLSIMNSKNVFR